VLLTLSVQEVLDKISQIIRNVNVVNSVGEINLSDIATARASLRGDWAMPPSDWGKRKTCGD